VWDCTYSSKQPWREGLKPACHQKTCQLVCWIRHIRGGVIVLRQSLAGCVELYCGVQLFIKAQCCGRLTALHGNLTPN